MISFRVRPYSSLVEGDEQPLDRYYKTNFALHSLRLDFDALFEFLPATLQYQFEALLMLPFELSHRQLLLNLFAVNCL